MSSSTPAYDVDVTGKTPDELEAIGRAGFENQRIIAFLPSLLSTWFDVFFLGTLCVLYSLWAAQARSTERLAHRILVYWLGLMGLCGTAIIQGETLTFFAISFGEYKYLYNIKFIRWYYAVTSLTRVPVSCYFLHRAYVLIGRRKWIIYCVTPQLLLVLVAGIVIVPFYKIPYPEPIRIVIMSMFAAEVSSDVIITITIGFQLYKRKSGFAKTDRLLTRLLIQTAETSTPPTAMAIILLLSFAILPNSTIQIILLFANKVQIGCVLVSLLARLRNAGTYASSGTAVTPVAVTARQQISSAGRSAGIHSELGTAGESGRSLVHVDYASGSKATEERNTAVDT